MYHRTGRVLSAAALATAPPTVVGVTSASAAPSPAAASKAGASTHMAAAYGGYPLHIKTPNTDVVGPLQIAVGRYGGVYVADNFAGVLKRIGVKKPLFTAPKGYEVAGVD